MPSRSDASGGRLVVRGAREHNLKDVSLDLPRDALIVFTGLSGSGKSSLAFDTIFAEGQRRYVESLVQFTKDVCKSVCTNRLEKMCRYTSMIS